MAKKLRLPPIPNFKAMYFRLCTFCQVKQGKHYHNRTCATACDDCLDVIKKGTNRHYQWEPECWGPYHLPDRMAEIDLENIGPKRNLQ